MKVIAFDQSTSKSGYSVFINGEYDHSGVVDFHLIENTQARFKRMYEELYKIVDKENPDMVIIEDVQAQGGNMATFKLLAQLQGILIGAFYARKIPYKIFTPTHWRRILEYKQGPKVKRAELKAQSKELVKKTFGWVKSEDENEAICINMAYHKEIADDGIDI